MRGKDSGVGGLRRPFRQFRTISSILAFIINYGHLADSGM